MVMVVERKGKEKTEEGENAGEKERLPSIKQS
jgi:hypothetical protein